jgi:N-glycosylase/DNA lyase
MSSRELKKAHQRHRPEILGRLEDFKRLKKASEERVLEELCFCLLTPGAKSENCQQIVTALKKKGLLFKNRPQDLWPFLKYARFYRQKADRWRAARAFFSTAGRVRIKEKVFCGDPRDVREWLVDQVCGLGYKEASHFLRNIGRGDDVAILDRHILKRLKNHGAIKELPKSLTRRRYLEIEEKMRQWSRRVNIPLAHLDLLFFSQATGQPVRRCK